MMGWGNHGYPMGWFGGIFMILFWAVVIAGIIFAIRYLVTGKESLGESGARSAGDPERTLCPRGDRYRGV